MTWPTILSRSRPPPRGPLRSSAGAARRPGRRCPRRLDEAGEALGVRRGRPAGGRGRVMLDGTPKSVPPLPSPVSTTRDPSLRRAASSRPAAGRRARSAARAAISASMARSASLPLRHQPGQSMAQTKVFLAPTSSPMSSLAMAPRIARRSVSRPSARRWRPAARSTRRRQRRDVAAVRRRARRPGPTRRSRHPRRPSRSPGTWAGLLTPNPTPTGTGDAAVTSRTRRPTVVGSAVRAPVTPTSETQ